MSGGYDPLLRYESPATGDPLAEETLLDKGRAPRMTSKAGRVTPHDPRLPPRGVYHPALGILHRPQVGIDKVHLLPVDTARPDHAPVAEVHRLRSGEDAGGCQVAVVLVPSVPGTCGG